MITQLFRITHQDGDDYHSTLSGSLKTSSVNNNHTDLDFYCADGKKISCHRAFILRFSTTLSSLIRKQTCCECLGEECARGHETIGISLADVQATTVMGLLDLLYTGQTTLIKKVQDATEILDLANMMLGMQLPKARLSLDAILNDGGVQSNIAFRRTKTHSMSRPGPLSNDMVDVVLIDEDGDITVIDETLVPMKRQRLDAHMPIEETDSDLEGTGKRKCPKCSKPYSSKWMTRHVNACTGEIGDEIDAEEPTLSRRQQSSSSARSAIPETTSSDDSEYKKCPHCGENFKIKGGWITRHTKSCTGPIKKPEAIQPIEKAKENRVSTISVSETRLPAVQDDRSKCPKCGEYFQNRGGVYFKHLNQCNAIGSQSIEVVASNSSAEISCKKCGKAFPANRKKNLDKHEVSCSASKRKPSANVSETEASKVGADSNLAEKYVVGPEEALSLYMQQVWKCFLCGSVCSKRDGMKAHLVLHFRSVLEAEEPKTYESLHCSRCKYIGSDKPILFIHIALTHQVLRKYIPSCLHDILFSKHTLESLKHSRANSESHSNSSDAIKSPAAPTPVTPAPAPLPVTPMQMTPVVSMYGEEKSWRCFLCPDVFKVKNQFKYHIIKHYRAELKKFIHETTPNVCTVCGVNCANFDSTLTHVAWTHQKMREILTKEQGNYLFGEEGSTAKTKPPTKPLAFVFTPQASEEKQSPGTLSCMFCGSKYSRRTELKSCLMTHAKGEVEKKYLPDESTRECSLCHYKAGSKDHLLTHLCLTHRKICDFLTPEYADMVFGRKRGAAGSEDVETNENSASEASTSTNDLQTKEKKSAKVCSSCDRTFSTELELKEHRVTCSRVSCGNCKDLFKDAAALKTHEIFCKPTAISFKCHMCEKTSFEHPHFLIRHLSTHYQDELLTLVSSVLPDDHGYFRCATCDYMTPSKDSLAFHLGYKHSSFLQFLPSEVLERYLALTEPTPNKDPNKDLSNGETPTGGNGHECPKCKKSFPSASMLSSHNESGECKAKKGKHADGKCLMCDETVQTFLEYKSHLFGHFEEAITKDLGEKYEKYQGKCVECGSNDHAFVEGETLSADGKSAFVRHLALDHDKIFTYLSSEIREDMRNAFSEGPKALPTTPPPRNKSSDPVEYIEIEPCDDSSEDDDIQIEAVDGTFEIKVEDISEST